MSKQQKPKQELNNDYIKQNIMETIELMKSRKLTGQQGNAIKGMLQMVITETRKTARENHELSKQAPLLIAEAGENDV